ncbi:NAD(P)H-hydrate dehydratase [Vibrio nereis]|uniref:NAD(P)H-hydrate dehydratase n=1 Tax=Vibrio nereis TaxID=693 RepID=UPI0024946D3C|nr:NAD(P)H-hydrate dehydratase [Vibrio nereis]
MTLPKGLYTGQQVKQGEAKAAEKAGFSLYELMEQAGAATYEVLKSNYPAAQHIAVLCGAGNNGGDGFVVAHLAKQDGIDVQLILTVDEAKLQGDAKRAMQTWKKAGGLILLASELTSVLENTDVIVDGILGTGLSGEVREVISQLIDEVNQSSQPVVAIDIPSGLCADTGTVLGNSICASHTVTFIALKRGLVTGSARNYVGKLHFAGLNVEQQFGQLFPSSVELLSLDELSSCIPRRQATAHKGHHGRLLCVGGNQGYSGAIRLCSYASARIGAGLVSCFCHPASSMALQVACPEVMTLPWQGDVKILASKLSQQTVVALGPGLGLDAWAQSLFDVVQASHHTKVVDADGLTLLAQKPNYDDNRVITPHPGEAARLLNWSVSEVEADRYSAVENLQRKYGGVVVLKGAGTLVFDGITCSVCMAGNPGMATGGMGDVLTGIIGGLLAQGLSIGDAARLGVQIHSQAADLVAGKQGMIGLLASDVIPEARRLLNFAP